MPEQTARIDGQTLPLADCVWAIWAPCGCPAGELAATCWDKTFATEQQAWAEIHPDHRERQQRQRQGYRLQLTSRDQADAIDPMAPCPHEKASQ